MNNNDYIVIQASMVTELGLSGNKLIVYALIHGFCKDGVHEFKGSINYICEWTNLSRNTVIATLKSLVDDGLIEKREFFENDIKFCSYRIQGSAISALPVQFLNGGSAISAPNNIINNNNNSTITNQPLVNKPTTNQKEEKEKTLKEKEKSLFEECWVAYNRKGSKKKSYDQWQRLTKKEKSTILQHIKVYVSTRDKQFQKDFERYLRDKTFNDIVIQNKTVVFDPNNGNDTNAYHPVTGGALTWNDYYKCYMYTGWYNDGDMMADGYNDDERPDGAQIVLNNARGTLTWDKKALRWNKN